MLEYNFYMQYYNKSLNDTINNKLTILNQSHKKINKINKFIKLFLY